jgi:hypothetical protein
MKLTQNKQTSIQQKVDINPTMLLYEYCKDIDDWPMRWEITKKDIASGHEITEQFKLFLLDRIKEGRAKRTIKNYATYLWALGGELIRKLNEDNSERKLPARKLILKYIDDSGGPYWRHAYNELEHSQYDSVCKQLFKFMIKTTTT